jgi:hypothetical protein
MTDRCANPTCPAESDECDGRCAVSAWCRTLVAERWPEMAGRDQAAIREHLSRLVVSAAPGWLSQLEERGFISGDRRRLVAPGGKS